MQIVSQLNPLRRGIWGEFTGCFMQLFHMYLFHVLEGYDTLVNQNASDPNYSNESYGNLSVAIHG